MISEKNLTNAEEKVLAAFRVGDSKVSVKGEVGGDFLRDLFLDEKADYRGTVIVGAIISDVLNMEFRETKFPVRFRGCSFAQKVKLRQLKCPELDFRGCTLKKGLDAPCAKMAGSVYLGDDFKDEFKDEFKAKFKAKFKAEGKVSLAGAVIGGQLICSGGSFRNKNKKKDAFFAQGIKVADVFLSSGFKAEGRVSLAGAEVRGQLNCEGGSFQNEKGDALSAQNIKVAEDVLLRYKFNAKGTVNLAGTDIGGKLDCTGGSFRNEGGNALNAQHIKVVADVLLIPHKHDEARKTENFSATGHVSFANATIGGNLELQNSKLTHLSLAGANVSGEFQDDADVYKNDQGGDIDLDIDGFRYQRLNAVQERVKDRLAWVGLMSKGDKKFRPQPYEQLMQVYRATGHTNEAREVGFALEQKRQEKMERGWWKGWYEVLRLTIGYGYRPYRFLWWFFGIILGGGLLFSGGLGAFGWALLINVFVIGALKKTPKLMWIGLLGFILCVSSAMAPCAKWESAESFWKHIPTVLTGITEWDGCETWRMRPTQPVVYLDGGEKTGSEERPGNHPQFIPLLYAAETAFPLFPLGQTGNWHPATWWVKLIQWIISILGIVVLAILVLYGAGLLGPRWRDK